MEIDQALHKLSSQQRECFLLFTVGARKQKEIAEILHISLGGVKSNIFQAKTSYGDIRSDFPVYLNGDKKSISFKVKDGKIPVYIETSGNIAIKKE